MTTPVASLGILASSILATGHLGQCSHASMRRALVHSRLGNNRLVRSSSPPSPPRSPAQTGISRFSANRPELAAIRARILSLQSADWIEGSVSGSLSLPWKIAFPDGEDGTILSTLAVGSAIAKRENCSARKINMTISLAFLAPERNRGSALEVSFSIDPARYRRRLERHGRAQFPSPRCSSLSKAGYRNPVRTRTRDNLLRERGMPSYRSLRRPRRWCGRAREMRRS
jgi:hypothetical protein